MEWRDEGLVLGTRRHGETSCVAVLLTRAYGKHAGLVHGATSKRMRALLQPGTEVSAKWRARLEEHLGTFTLELVAGHAAPLLTRPAPLAALSAACTLVELGLGEREPHPELYEDLLALFGALGQPDWAAHYVMWEIALLSEFGFGLDLSRCAATGRNDQLAYVSPRTGRAVSLSAGEAYKDRLLVLPPFLIGAGEVTRSDIVAGLRLTGHFLDRHVCAPHNRPLPDVRARLAELVARGAAEKP